MTGINGGFPTKNLVLLTEYAIVLWKKRKTTLTNLIVLNNMRKASKAEISHAVKKHHITQQNGGTFVT